MKTKPTRFAGWDGKNLGRPYPHAGIRRQQQRALMAIRLDMEIRIGVEDASVKRCKPLLAGEDKSFLHRKSSCGHRLWCRTFGIR